MRSERENNEGKIFGLVEKYTRHNKVLEEIQKDKGKFAATHTRSGEWFDIISNHVSVSQRLATGIAELLPEESGVSTEDQVVWSGHLSELEIVFLGGNRFKISGPNLSVVENADPAQRLPDEVSLAINRDIELSVNPNESIESLYGLPVKIYRK